MIDDERMADELRAFYEEEPVVQPDRIQMTHDVLDEIHGKPQGRRTRWRLPSFKRTSSPSLAMPGTDYQPSPIPATNGHSPTVLGRTQSMLSPIKTIAAGALVFAIGGTFLIAQPFDQEPGIAPATSIDSERHAPEEFTGRMRYGAGLDAGSAQTVDGVIEARGEGFTPSVVSMSDPRLTGTAILMTDANVYGGENGVRVDKKAFRIENEAGAWQEEPGFVLTFPDTSTSNWTSVFIGEGDYEGLIAIADVVHGGGGWDFHGFIVDGDLPPDPAQASME